MHRAALCQVILGIPMLSGTLGFLGVLNYCPDLVCMLWGYQSGQH